MAPPPQSPVIIHDLTFVCALCQLTGMTPPEIAILGALFRGDKESSDIMKRCHLKETTFYRSMKSLREAGLIKRLTEQSPDSPRKLYVYTLTSKGRQDIYGFEQSYQRFCTRAMGRMKIHAKKDY